MMFHMLNRDAETQNITRFSIHKVCRFKLRRMKDNRQRKIWNGMWKVNWYRKSITFFFFFAKCKINHFYQHITKNYVLTGEIKYIELKVVGEQILTSSS